MKWFSDLSISRKFTVSFVVIAILAIVTGAVGLFIIGDNLSKSKHTYETNTSQSKYLVTLVKDYQTERAIIEEYSLDKKEQREKLISEVREADARIADSIANLKKGIDAQSEAAAAIDAVEKSVGKFQAFREDEFGLIDRGSTSMALSLINEDGNQGDMIATDTEKTIDDLVALKQREADQSYSQMQVMGNTFRIVMFATMAASIVISVLLGIFLSRNIGYPITVMTAIAQLLAAGDVDIDAVLQPGDHNIKKRRDEIGKLALSFNKLVESIREQAQLAGRIAGGELTVSVPVRSENDLLGRSLLNLVRQFGALADSISLAADHVLSGAQMVSDSSFTLSQGAAEQASSIQQLTASMEEISSQTTINAKNAETASALSASARNLAESGNTRMRELLDSMEKINVSSKNINKIIKVIDDIAFQTNILALNAAVEAARAGTAGKGFSVVADEVRLLAQRSAGAASETAAIIQGSIKTVEAAARLANETAEALGHIVAEVEKASQLVRAIAGSSAEQAAAIGQINEGITMVSRVVQTNAATSGESAAASEELSEQAVRLKEILSVFKTSAGENPAPEFGDAGAIYALPVPAVLRHEPVD
ncbi:methyl-accepting chemotaxis protein [Sporobacter termitidis DSM 10068]|uniref:Methyl-accepting chemotaxis protein n=1 Tax=Sporobacter termitidis DSM 10068 TaxID=1123282 RepID=A0A1M5TQK8_9FIRM|nr:methyl-accepting chemotaxis protein [Sporobacter termitidis]SHH52979.1 methyl-accepting chemotaxis protein [Sporobacter termitidis DSM 10068]